MKARYPSYMKHSRIWKFILLGLLIVILVPFGLFALGNVVASHYNGLDYPWHYPDTVWRSEEPRAEITVDGKGRTTLYLEVNGEMRLLELGQLGISVDIYSVSEGGHVFHCHHVEFICHAVAGDHRSCNFCCLFDIIGRQAKSL